MMQLSSTIIEVRNMYAASKLSEVINKSTGSAS
jgi:hypothetical protein